MFRHLFPASYLPISSIHVSPVLALNPFVFLLLPRKMSKFRLCCQNCLDLRIASIKYGKETRPFRSALLEKLNPNLKFVTKFPKVPSALVYLKRSGFGNPSVNILLGRTDVIEGSLPFRTFIYQCRVQLQRACLSLEDLVHLYFKGAVYWFPCELCNTVVRLDVLFCRWSLFHPFSLWSDAVPGPFHRFGCSVGFMAMKQCINTLGIC